jgi:hypothetical protein
MLKYDYRNNGIDKAFPDSLYLILSAKERNELINGQEVVTVPVFSMWFSH